MDKEDDVHIYNGILLNHKKNEMLFAATWMDLEIITLSEVRSKRQTLYDIIYMWNLKKKIQINELICRTEIDSQTLKNLWLPKRIGWGG